MYTIFGATGLVGKALCARLTQEGENFICPGRSMSHLPKNLGHVIYCIGNDRFDEAPFSVVETHVSILASVLEKFQYETFLYLSTTRLYMEGPATCETAPVTIDLSDRSQLFNATKLAGEALCLAMKNERVRVARLSNVTEVNPYSHLFLPTIIREAIVNSRIKLFLAPDSAKDYILLQDVIDALLMIVKLGTNRIYNVASGMNVAASAIVDVVQRSTACEVRWHGGGRALFTPIDIDRMQHEFKFKPKSMLQELPDIIAQSRCIFGPPRQERS